MAKRQAKSSKWSKGKPADSRGGAKGGGGERGSTQRPARPGRGDGDWSARDFVKNQIARPLRSESLRPGVPVRGRTLRPSEPESAPAATPPVAKPGSLAARLSTSVAKPKSTDKPADATSTGNPLLDALKDLPTGATANQIATKLGNSRDGREMGQSLRKLVQLGQVMEVRPGRYQISGTGGEYAAVIEAAPAGGLQAKLGDGRILKVNPLYDLGVKAGDVVQATIGEDGVALITRTIRRTGREVVGAINFRPGGMVLVADNRREGELPVLTAFARFRDEYKAGDRVVGTIETSPDGSAGVHLTRILSAETPEVTDFRYVCLAHDLPGEHPEEVVAQAKAYRGEFPLGNREDLRGELVFTIDPETAKDFDDAISLAKDAQGRWVLGVHIADVSHYVTQFSPLDREAAQRATSIYLINRVIPMLPESLSNGLCSLVPEEDRYCLSAFLTLDRGLRLVNTRLAETVINSRHRFTYEEALEVLEGRDRDDLWPDDVREVVRQVGEIAQGLRKAREKAGALNLFSVEHRFALDVDGVPTGVAKESTDISHQLIEECMLLANRAVAQWLIDKSMPCIFRIHEQPDEERLRVLAHLLEVYGLDSARIQNRFGFQKLLFDLAKEPPTARLVLNFLCLRSFKKAVYSIDNVGHYALAFDAYAHFTSPIRRYPDLLVHRLVKCALGLPGYKDTEVRRGYLDALAKQSSNLEQRAETAERDLHARKATRYLAARMGETFAGVVTGATPGGLSVQLIETGMEGFVPVRELKDDFYEYDQDRFALVGRRSGRVWGIGEELDVLVAAADIDRCDVVLSLAGGGGPVTRRLQRQERDEGNRIGRERRGPHQPDTKHAGKHTKRQERLSKQEQKREERKRRRDERNRRGK